jgi:hypothetical protein
MTDKKTVFGIAVATTTAAVLGIVVLFGAVRHFASRDQARATGPAAARQIVELPNPALSRIRLLVSNPN